MKYIRDEEDLLVSIRDHVKENLNSKIAALNSEKGDFTIDEISADDEHYVLGGELLDLPNHTFVNFVFSGDIETTTNGTSRASLPNILIEVAFDNKKTKNMFYSSLRYMRALYETMLEYQNTTFEAVDLQLTKTVPMVITANRRELVVSGVNVSIGIS